MIEPNLPGLSVGKQCALLSVSRSSFYYEAKGESELNLDLMRQIDEQCPGHTVLWRTPDDLASSQRRPPGKRKARPAAHAVDGSDADLPEAQYQQGGEGAQDLPVPAA